MNFEYEQRMNFGEMLTLWIQKIKKELWLKPVCETEGWNPLNTLS